MKKNIYSNALIVLSIITITSCTNTPQKEEQVKTEPVKEITYTTDDPKSIIKAVEMSCGSWNKLWEQKDVEFSYSYKYADGKEDFSVERYVFDTEQSWAKYTKHDINVMPGTEGDVIQYYDGESAYIKQNDEMLDNQEAIGGTHFLRKANYFWFVMMFKLDNPGVNYEYLGAEELNGVNYDKVNVSYDASVTGKEQNDTYILYVNSETKMVDQFYFSLPAFGVNEPLIRMELKYEEINGLKIASTRNIFMPSEAGYSEAPNLVQTSTNVKFNNSFTEEQLSL